MIHEIAMETLTAIFAHVCGQGRCFIIDGVPLPVCERCSGLYFGALLTGVWLLASRIWRRGLPQRRVVCLQAGALILALLGGLHVLDTGPGWRLLCGLWTGHVAAVWLVTGASQLKVSTRRMPSGMLTWPRKATVQAIVASLAMPLLAGLLVVCPHKAWWGWTSAIVCGSAILAAAVTRALLVLAIVAWSVAGLAPRRDRRPA